MKIGMNYMKNRYQLYENTIKTYLTITKSLSNCEGLLGQYCGL